MAEPSASESSAANDSDGDFDPTADMLVNDFDDEHTLDEEEAIDDPENEEEIDDLTKEGEMPLEELMALYGYGGGGASSSTSVEKQTAVSSSTTQADGGSNSNSSSLDQSVPQPSQQSNSSSTPASRLPVTPQQAGATISPLWHLPSTNTLMEVDESDSEPDDEEEYEEGGEDWRRTIQVGSEYQAQIPEGLCRYDDVPAYENEDKVLWIPNMLHDKEVEEYLRQIQHLKAQDSDGGSEGGSSNGDGPPLVPIPDPTLPLGCHIRDDEQALYLLQQCGNKAEEALRRRRMQSQKNGLFDPMTSWSEDECRNFEEGLRIYGKDFHLIQKNKVRTRSVSELVQFYYYWKKTERHDVFASKWRIEKKKYSLHPGTTDYMDRFLDEQENLPAQAQPLNTTSPALGIQASSRVQTHAQHSIYPAYHPSTPGNIRQVPLDALSTSNSSDNNTISSTTVITNGSAGITDQTIISTLPKAHPTAESLASLRSDSHLNASSVAVAADSCK